MCVYTYIYIYICIAVVQDFSEGVLLGLTGEVQAVKAKMEDYITNNYKSQIGYIETFYIKRYDNKTFDNIF